MRRENRYTKPEIHFKTLSYDQYQILMLRNNTVKRRIIIAVNKVSSHKLLYFLKQRVTLKSVE